MPPLLTAVAHNLRSLHNVGAIFRTSDGAGFSRIVLSGYTGAPPDPRIAKVALGAEDAVPFVRAETHSQLLVALDGAFVVVLEQHPSSVPVTQLSVPAGTQRIALVVCEELFGASPELIDSADSIVEIPMRGTKESLNASVAFGIAAYHLADLALADGTESLRSRAAGQQPRVGVLTQGPTVSPSKASSLLANER